MCVGFELQCKAAGRQFHTFGNALKVGSNKNLAVHSVNEMTTTTTVAGGGEGGIDTLQWRL